MASCSASLAARPGVATVTTAGINHGSATFKRMDHHRAACATATCRIVLHVVAIGAAHVDHARAGDILRTQNDNTATRCTGGATAIRIRTPNTVVAVGCRICGAVVGTTRTTATTQENAVEGGGTHIATAATTTAVDQGIRPGPTTQSAGGVVAAATAACVVIVVIDTSRCAIGTTTACIARGAARTRASWVAFDARIYLADAPIENRIRQLCAIVSALVGQILRCACNAFTLPASATRSSISAHPIVSRSLCGAIATDGTAKALACQENGTAGLAFHCAAIERQSIAGINGNDASGGTIPSGGGDTADGRRGVLRHPHDLVGLLARSGGCRCVAIVIGQRRRERHGGPRNRDHTDKLIQTGVIDAGGTLTTTPPAAVGAGVDGIDAGVLHLDDQHEVIGSERSRCACRISGTNGQARTTSIQRCRSAWKVAIYYASCRACTVLAGRCTDLRPDTDR